MRTIPIDQLLIFPTCIKQYMKLKNRHISWFFVLLTLKLMLPEKKEQNITTFCRFECRVIVDLLNLNIDENQRNFGHLCCKPVCISSCTPFSCLNKIHV